MTPHPGRSRRRVLGRVMIVVAIATTMTALTTTTSQAAQTRRSVTLVAPASTTTGATVTMSGRLTHSPKGSLVRIRRQSGHAWVSAATTHTSSATGTYSVRVVVPKTRGTYAFDAYVVATKKLRAATSASRKVIVRTPFVAKLDWPTATFPNGASLTLEGQVTPWVAHTAVTLQQRHSPTAAWTQVSALSPTSSGMWTKTFVPTPSTTTWYRVVVATNGYYLGTASKTVAQSTYPPYPSIVTASLPDGTVDAAYSTTLAGNESSGYWSVTSGSLPAGLTLTGAVISGTPTTPGSSPFTVTYMVGSQSASQQFSIWVDPAPVQASSIQSSVSAGGLDTCRIAAGGALSCWGSDQWGELGINGDPLNNPSENTPQAVVPSKSWVAVSAGLFNGGGEDVCGIQADRSLWCWGADSYGEDGHGGIAEYNAPIEVAAGTHWSQVAEGATFGCGIRTNGMLCRGNIGAAAGTTGPVQFGVASSWTQITAGAGHACAIDASQHLWCWGTNYQGWLGDGTTDAQALPEQIGTATWSEVDASQGHTCGVQTNHTLWCWGTDSDGQLGQGATGAALWSPTQVGTATDWAQVSTGGEGNDNHTCAVKTDGTLWCWGSNDDDQAVGGAAALLSSPTQMASGGSSPWASVSAGGDHTCALDTLGKTYCWGGNGEGQIGNGSAVTPVSTPASIP